MPTVKCPITACTFDTDELDAVIVAVLLTTHAVVHNAAPAALMAPAVKVERMKRPSVSSAGTSEDWMYFLSRWKDYVEATKVPGKQLVIQLLEILYDQQAGHSLINQKKTC